MTAFTIQLDGTPEAKNEVWFELYQVTVSIDPLTQKGQSSFRLIPIFPCNSNDFDLKIYNVHQTFLKQCLCPQNASDIFIKGDTTSQDYTYLAAYVYKNDCNGWLNLNDFYYQLSYAELITFYQVPYLDFNDLNDPLKFKAEVDFTHLDLSAYTSRVTKISLNEYEVENSYLFYPPKTGIFYNIKSSDIGSLTYKEYTSTGWLGEIKLYFTPTKTSYQVNMYNIYDLIAQLGGIYGMIFEIFGILAFYVARKTYEYSLVNWMNNVESDIADSMTINKKSAASESLARPMINREPRHRFLNLTKLKIANKF